MRGAVPRRPASRSSAASSVPVLTAAAPSLRSVFRFATERLYRRGDALANRLQGRSRACRHAARRTKRLSKRRAGDPLTMAPAAPATLSLATRAGEAS